MTVDYYMAYQATPDDLEEDVEDCLAEGWRLVGGGFSAIIGGKTYLCQAMTRVTPEPSQPAPGPHWEGLCAHGPVSKGFQARQLR